MGTVTARRRVATALLDVIGAAAAPPVSLT